MRKIRLFQILSAVFCAAALTAAGSSVVRAEESRQILDGIHIGSVDVGGMSDNEAQTALDTHIKELRATTFTLSGTNGSVEMTGEEMDLSADVDTALWEAVTAGRAGNLIRRYQASEDLKRDNLVIDLKLAIDKQATAQVLYKKTQKLNVKALDNSLVREDGVFRFVPGREGNEIDIVQSVYALEALLTDNWNGTDTQVALVSNVVQPRGSQEELAQVQDLLGSFSTGFASSSAGRAKNVTTGTSKVDGTLLFPGDEFTLRTTVSPFTKENGYELAGSYLNGTTVESFGGGICQVATTLYNAVILAELDVTMRSNHSMLVNYVEPSMDAAIAGDYKDLHFKNNRDIPIYIEGYCRDRVLYFNIYGKETRPANRTVSYESETLSTEDMQLEFEQDAGLDVGYWSVLQSAHRGCKAQLWKVVKVDGVQQSREVINKSTYRSSPKIIKIGTKGLSEEQLASLQTAINSKDEGAVKSLIQGYKAQLSGEGDNFGEGDAGDDNNNPGGDNSGGGRPGGDDNSGGEDDNSGSGDEGGFDEEFDPSLEV